MFIIRSILLLFLCLGFGCQSLRIQSDLVAHDFEKLLGRQRVIVAAQLSVIGYVAPVLFQNRHLTVQLETFQSHLHFQKVNRAIVVIVKVIKSSSMSVTISSEL